MLEKIQKSIPAVCFSQLTCSISLLCRYRKNINNLGSTVPVFECLCKMSATLTHELSCHEKTFNLSPSNTVSLILVCNEFGLDEDSVCITHDSGNEFWPDYSTNLITLPGAGHYTIHGALFSPPSSPQPSTSSLSSTATHLPPAPNSLVSAFNLPTLLLDSLQNTAKQYRAIFNFNYHHCYPPSLFGKMQKNNKRNFRRQAAKFCVQPNEQGTPRLWSQKLRKGVQILKLVPTLEELVGIAHELHHSATIGNHDCAERMRAKFHSKYYFHGAGKLCGFIAAACQVCQSQAPL